MMGDLLAGRIGADGGGQGCGDTEPRQADGDVHRAAAGVNAPGSIGGDHDVDQGLSDDQGAGGGVWRGGKGHGVLTGRIRYIDCRSWFSDSTFPEPVAASQISAVRGEGARCPEPLAISNEHL